jgi:hypothetical protein
MLDAATTPDGSGQGRLGRNREPSHCSWNKRGGLNTNLMSVKKLTRTQQLLTPLRESIVDKPPYINGTLKLPESYFSLFYRTPKDDAARSREP